MDLRTPVSQAPDPPQQQPGVRLRRLGHRIIWVNRRKAGPDDQPLVGGMAAALSCGDAFVSGHNYDALLELPTTIRGIRHR
ncbi:hypothetical protein AOC05_06075 [Arthrobacter alpinus]|uniref:Uncharacterized protein n=2 Tax=Arthrobacter alpinus TaxID=656366 RepID=A0A0M5M1K3_9MICC|nr:hypothetical protein AOC05_06075 [Arthrobacter alpinus]